MYERRGGRLVGTKRRGGGDEKRLGLGGLCLEKAPEGAKLPADPLQITCPNATACTNKCITRRFMQFLYENTTIEENEYKRSGSSLSSHSLKFVTNQLSALYSYLTNCSKALYSHGVHCCRGWARSY